MQLRPLSEKPKQQQTANPVQNRGEVSRLFEDLRDIIFAYQVCS